MTAKRTILITIAVLLLIFVGLVVYNLFLKNRTTTPFSFFRTPEESLGEAPTPSPESPFIRLTNEPIAGFRVVDNEIVVVGVDGQFRRLDFFGETLNEESQSNLSGLVKAAVNPGGNAAAITITDQETADEHWVLLEEMGRLQTLPAGTIGLSFSPQGKILTTTEQNSKTILSVKQGTEIKNIFETSVLDVVVIWANENTVLITTKPSGLAPGIAYSLDVNTKKLTRLLGSQNGLSALLPQQLNRIVFSETSTDGRGLSFKVLDLSNQTERTLPVSTLPEKCIFSQDNRTLFCAAFVSNPTSSIMPDDYYKGVFANDSNTFVRINLESDRVETIVNEIPVDAIELQLSPDEQSLFFINKKDGALYRLKLD